ncbi:efflux RND transporter periplasmic adaptor subunit [SAR86 cluster bacterium]|nr:efflux RND transporter periplasmic adaptor subunit [SAR86 cluster bacterium]
MFSKYIALIRDTLMTRSNIEWSAMFLGFSAIWMVSGFFVTEEGKQEIVFDKESTVRVIDQTSLPYTREILVKGFAEADKKVELKAETSGRVISLPAKQGSFVKKGQPICSIFMAEKESFFKKAELEFKSAEKLFDEGLYSSNQFQNIKSNYERAKLELDNATIKAPFPGIVDRIALDEGDFLSRGSTCAVLLDLDPMIISGDISETDVGFITVGSSAKVETLDGSQYQGKISFISSSANNRTHTFRIEITVDNKSGNIKDGASARIFLQGENQLANLVPLSILRLDDAGDLGIRIVGSSGFVEFVKIKLIQDTKKGAWVSGLPKKTRIITVGQDYVSDGEKVEIAIDERLMSDERIN